MIRSASAVPIGNSEIGMRSPAMATAATRYAADDEEGIKVAGDQHVNGTRQPFVEGIDVADAQAGRAQHHPGGGEGSGVGFAQRHPLAAQFAHRLDVALAHDHVKRFGEQVGDRPQRPDRVPGEGALAGKGLTGSIGLA